MGAFIEYLVSDLFNFIVYFVIFSMTLTLKKNGKLYIVLLVLSSYISVFVFKALFDYQTGALNTAHIFIICLVAYKERYYQKLLVLFTSFIVQLLIEITSLVILSTVNNSVYLYFFEYHKSIFSVCTILIYLLILVLIQFIRVMTNRSAKIDLSQLQKRHMLIIITLLMIVFVYSIYIDWLLGSKATISFDIPTAFLLATLLMVVILVVGVGLFLHRLFVNNQLQQTNELIAQQLNNQLVHYQQLESTVIETRKIKHDMNNHLICLNYLLAQNQTDEALSYLSQIKSSIDMINSPLETGNTITDAIINSKLSYHKAANIEFNLSGSIPKREFISPVDLCTILANSLDNAFEACLNMQTQVKKEITIESHIRQSHWIYKISNTCEPIKSTTSSKLQTTKADKESHGFGLTNIQNAVNKNKGHMAYQYEGNRFVLEIAIPYEL